LILGEGQEPKPERYYKKRTFRLGLPEEKCGKIYYRAQYPPHPEQISIFREFFEQLIRAGSPHNSSIMQVPKKTPGNFRVVTDNRLVNADCVPVGAMSASPLSIIRMMAGATIFTTVDCKNAFYSLQLDEADTAYTAISPTGLPRLELTRMPMGARASMVALYQAMIDILGEALYQYDLVMGR